VPRLIHLNGPSGVGKSTVAQRYADRHPGVLNLDIDRIVTMIGGWRDDVRQALGPARTLAIGMAGAHLAGGRDVIMPQLVADHEQAARFESAARAAGGEYREIALTADRRTLRERCTARPRTFVDDVLAEGGPELLDKIYDDVATYLRDRPDAIVLDTGDADADRTYTALVTALTDL
jgi:predicted kinase